MIWEKAIPQEITVGGLEKMKKPRKRRAEGEQAGHTGGLSSLGVRVKTSPGAQNPNPLAALTTRSLPGPSTILPITTGWEKRSFSERAGGASQRKGSAQTIAAMMIYCLLSKGRRNLSQVVSDLVFVLQCSGNALVSVKWKEAGDFECWIPAIPGVAVQGPQRVQVCVHRLSLGRKANLREKIVFSRKPF